MEHTALKFEETFALVESLESTEVIDLTKPVRLTDAFNPDSWDDAEVDLGDSESLAITQVDEFWACHTIVLSRDQAITLMRNMQSWIAIV